MMCVLLWSDWCEITSVIHYMYLWHVLAKCEQCSQCSARYRYKDRSNPQEVLQSKLMRLIAVHAVKHKNTEEERKQPILQTVMLHSHVFSPSGALCEHKWNTLKCRGVCRVRAVEANKSWSKGRRFFSHFLYPGEWIREIRSGKSKM